MSSDNTRSNSQIHEERRVYGRRIGRPLSPAKQKLLQEFYPEISVPTPKDAQQVINPRALFPETVEQIWFEIGFGDGGHLYERLKAEPNNAFIGAEPFLNGVVTLLSQLKRETADRQNRARLWKDDAILLLQHFANESLDGFYILNPDPWPKTRHHKRRIVNEESLDLFARILKPGGTLMMTTDVDDLAEWMVTRSMLHPRFSWTARSYHDWREAPHNWIATKYETKGANHSSRQQTYLRFIKK